jgi:hypothetical protein
VLVNLQDYSVFASHTLDRDVWSSDIVKDIIRNNFIFVQVWGTNFFFLPSEM